MPEPVEVWVSAVRDAERRGELLSAFDLAERGLDHYPDDLWLRHRAVLALARAGSTDEALRRFQGYHLGAVEDEDVQALRARLAKDVALQAHGRERRSRARHAGDLYRAVFELTGGHYPAVNAATMLLVAGRPEEARRTALRALEAVADEPGDSYYAAASEAEANLVLGRTAEARRALQRAAALADGDYGALSTTRRQLRLVCQEAGSDAALLQEIAGPGVVHFCGHRIGPPDGGGRFPAAAESAVAARIAAEVERDPPGFAYGALANGADLLFAEALLAAGTELHVVLPFDADEFVRSSVADRGEVWVERFRRCSAAATSVRYATEDAYLNDEVLYRYGSEFAMGLALLRGRFLDAPVRQLAVWDSLDGQSDAGTAIDVRTWTSRGRPVTIIDPGSGPSPAATPTPTASAAGGRVVRSMLFADVSGFSRLTDEQIPRFARRVLGEFAAALARHGDAICYRNTWGDALYVVFEDTVSAADCALDLQEAMERIPLARSGLPDHLALRLGAHTGPVYPVDDPVVGQGAFMGSHVSRTARIEPVTPPGAVYVTEPFAAALVLEGDRFGCDYVGHVPAAKDYGQLRMYRLRRRQARRPLDEG